MRKPLIRRAAFFINTNNYTKVNLENTQQGLMLPIVCALLIVYVKRIRGDTLKETFLQITFLVAELLIL